MHLISAFSLQKKYCYQSLLQVVQIIKVQLSAVTQNVVITLGKSYR